MPDDASTDFRPIRSLEDLLSVFQASEKAPGEFRIGAESEKFGVHAETGQPLAYDGEFSVRRLFGALAERGWHSEREVPEGPVVALRRGGQSITLEPGSQFELSGSALSDVHAVQREFQEHLAELSPIVASMNLVWLGVGFQPIARQSDLGWVPKQRYAIMREYLPPRGDGAHDMMRRTATIQANFDFSSEADALRKLRTNLLLAPLIQAIFANSPFVEGRRAPHLSHRGSVWLRMDPARSGLVCPVLVSKHPSYRDYVEWALDAGMFLFKRGSQIFANSGQTFRDFLARGFQGERATLADWKLHLNTLFPEARLKNTLEVRSCDALPARLSGAVPALFTGFLYDELALARASELADQLGLAAIESARLELVTGGLSARIGGVSARTLAERLLEIASDGLGRRARLNQHGQDERIYLAPLIPLVSRGLTPADVLLQSLPERSTFSTRELIEKTRIDAP